MGKSIDLGRYSCENNVLDKTDWLTWVETGVNCEMLNTDILNPILKLDNSGGTGKDRLSYTYCKITDFGRYYFVNSIETIAGGHVIMHCHVDVLHTYRTGIKNMEGYVLRNEDKAKWKKDITDRCIPASNMRVGWSDTFGKHFISAGTSGNIYLLGYI